MIGADLVQRIRGLIGLVQGIILGMRQRLQYPINPKKSAQSPDPLYSYRLHSIEKVRASFSTADQGIDRIGAMDYFRYETKTSISN